MPPFHLLVDRMIIREASRLCTLPPTHPLYAHVKRAARWVKRHRSPLHEILAAYSLQPTEIETIAATRHPPGWRAPCTVSISATKDDAADDELAEQTADSDQGPEPNVLANESIQYAIRDILDGQYVFIST